MQSIWGEQGARMAMACGVVAGVSQRQRESKDEAAGRRCWFVGFLLFKLSMYLIEMHPQLRFCTISMQVRTGAAQVEGGIHGLVSYEKKLFWCFDIVASVGTAKAMECKECEGFPKWIMCMPQWQVCWTISSWTDVQVIGEFTSVPEHAWSSSKTHVPNWSLQ